MPHGVAFTCSRCLQNFTSRRGLGRHENSKHRQFTPADEDEDENCFDRHFHPLANALPCDVNGNFLAPHVAPPPPPPPPEDGQDPAAWAPFDSRWAFDWAYFQFVELQASERHINTALDIWAASLCDSGRLALWTSAQELYADIDRIQHGDVPWKTCRMRYKGPLPAGTPPRWMTQDYELCTRDVRLLLRQQLGTSTFKDSADYVPYRQFNRSGDRVWSNFMSGEWAWKQADLITEDPDNHGCAFVAAIAGSDKTTVSVATGHQEYHPVYVSPGVLTGMARRAHGNGVLPAAFLVIPKTSKKHRTKPAYQTFVRQMYHASLAHVFRPLKAYMTTPDIAHPAHLDEGDARPRSKSKTDILITCFDPGILWDDYGTRSDVVPFTHDFPRADIHELLSSDLLHQVIKGTFKDHLVTWVNEYLVLEHGEKRAFEIIQDIDRRLSAVPEFPGLRRFPDGRDFHQWTGDDSKALMKIYLGAVAGYLPSDMVKALAAFMEFCYLVRRNAISTSDLTTIKNVLGRFHQYRAIFIECGVRTDISLPRQHSLVHYPRSIQLFGSPNGLCLPLLSPSTSKPSKSLGGAPADTMPSPRCSGQACIRHSWDDGRYDVSYTAKVFAGLQPQVAAVKAAAAIAVDDDEDDDGVVHRPRSLSDIELAPTPQRGYPKYLAALAAHIGHPSLPLLLRRFLHAEVYGPLADGAAPPALDACPNFDGEITVHHSAIARFYAPSDLCGAGGMYRERIRSNPRWHGYARRDTVLVDVGGAVMGGIIVGRVMLFFSFDFAEREYQCALVHWYVPVGDQPDPDTGMWVVEPEFFAGAPSMDVIDVDAIARASHLIGVYGTGPLPEDFHFSSSLDAFETYFVNPYADHHMHEFLT
ncbi:hypothetical protein B0H12DRAFT_1326085 [Mycena haematopus]|nr:hypothetical protein B0H12DRAFT_1326085 [Mycena haematopus]